MLRLGKVVAVRPEDHAVDVLMLHDLSRHVGVQVLCEMCATDSGTSHMVEPELGNPGDKWEPKDGGTRDILCVVGMLQGTQPVVIGFLHQQVVQVLFKRKNFHVTRHPSDVYSTIDNDGNAELYHPSGTYVRIGTSPKHEDLTAKDFDKKWKIKRNTDKKVHVHVEIPGKVILNMSPEGKVDLYAASDINVTSDTQIVMKAPAIYLN